MPREPWGAGPGLRGRHHRRLNEQAERNAIRRSHRKPDREKDIAYAVMWAIIVLMFVAYGIYSAVS